MMQHRFDIYRSLAFGACAFVILCLAAVAGRAQDTREFWYETGSINQGLAAVENDLLERSTPRQTIRAFLAQTEAGEFERAAHYLNLARTDPAQQTTLGAEKAQKLKAIIDRQVWIDWSDLSARPDALRDVAAKSGSSPRTPRRDLHIATLETRDTAYDIRIARYKPEGAPAVWLFSPQTVSNIDPLYRAFGPGRYETLIPAVLKDSFLGLWIWEWLALPTLGLAVLLLGWGVHAVVSSMAGRVERPWLKRGLERSRLPLCILFMAGAGQTVLLQVFSFSGPVQTLLKPTLIILMVWGVGMTILRLFDALLQRLTLRFVGEIDDKRGRDEREFYTSIYALRRLIVLVMVAVALIVILSQLNLFESVGMTLLASAGVLTVVFGIAGQAVLGNILASLQIAFAKPVRIGDAILFEGDWAYVESIFYTFLRLRTWDQRRIVVPVTYFVARPFENWSVADARIMRVVHLCLDPRADVECLRQTFAELLRADPDIDEVEGACTFATEQTAEGLTVSFYAMMPDPSTGWIIQSRLREQLLAHVRDTHPDWLPRERVMDVSQDADGGRTRTAVRTAG